MAKQDLIPFSKRTEDKQKEIASIGGIASGKARRVKKLMRDMAEEMLAGKAPEGEDVEELLSRYGVSREDADIQMAILLAQADKALKGDTRACEFLRDTAGEKPTDKVQVSDTTPLTIIYDYGDK